MSVSSTVTVPAFGRRMPEMMLRSVVLPLPEGPTTYTISPKYASKLASRTAYVLASPSPNHLPSPVAWMAVLGIVHPLKMSKGSILSTLRTPT